jgi:hypothetical protein
MGTEVQEQETYGVDYVTGRDIIRCLQDVLPEYTEDDLWEISDRLMVQVSLFLFRTIYSFGTIYVRANGMTDDVFCV